ncbi:haloalkane dehalogenase [Omnitrophica bacterium]|nr:haloalkane dehalogenase [Candidatus Omnitrophota bacterium]
MKPTKNTSSAFPFEPQYAEVLGSKMHYVESGKGSPLLFIHGNPTSSYLWRNIIPYLASLGRCIAVDLIGMGKSAKPPIAYDFMDHARHIEGFIEKLRLKNVTFVLHDWGGALGGYYASQHPDNIRGLAFLEPVIRSYEWKEFPWMARFIFKRFRDPVKGPKWILDRNCFVEHLLPLLTVRRLSKTEMNHYRQPFRNPADRTPVLAWPNQVPIDGKPRDTYRILFKMYQQLCGSAIPKLLLYGKPGALIRSKDVRDWKRSMINLETVKIGKGKHYLPEDQPHNIGIALAKWFKRLQGPEPSSFDELSAFDQVVDNSIKGERTC